MLNETVDAEPPFEGYRDYYGELAALGIEKGKPFTPDDRMKAILEQAARNGIAEMRVQSFADRRPDRLVWTGSANGNGRACATRTATSTRRRNVDSEAREKWFYQAIGASPAMFRRETQAGSLYWLGLRDAEGAYLDGGKTYKLSVPQPVPGKLFWSVTVYDIDDACADPDRLRTWRRCGRCSSSRISPEPPPICTSVRNRAGGNEDRWIKTIPGKGWFAYFRISTARRTSVRRHMAASMIIDISLITSPRDGENVTRWLAIGWP